MALLDIPWTDGPVTTNLPFYVTGTWYLGYRGLFYVEARNDDSVSRLLTCTISGQGEGDVYLGPGSSQEKVMAPGEVYVFELDATAAPVDIYKLSFGDFPLTILSMGLGAYTAPVFWTNFSGQTETP